MHWKQCPYLDRRSHTHTCRTCVCVHAVMQFFYYTFYSTKMGVLEQKIVTLAPFFLNNDIFLILKLGYLSQTRQVVLLILLSELYLRRSSNKSLMAVTPNTNITGSIAISLPKAEIWGNQFRSTMEIK